MEKTLHALGLGNKEQVVYKLILEHGKIAPALLSRLAKINRTTVYSVAKELREKGLIVEDLGGRTLYYLPTRNAGFEKLIEKEHENAENRVKLFRELQEFLKNVPESKSYSVPKIRFIEEDELESYLYEALPRWIANMLITDATWWGFQDHTFVEKFEKAIDWSWDKSPKEIDLKLFSNESDIEKKMKNKKYHERRHIKSWKTDEFTATQLVAGDYIIMIVTKERPYYLVEIYDAVMAENLRSLFRNLWDMRK